MDDEGIGTVVTPKADQSTHGARDRAAGALLGLAVGDAVGAPWEFGQPRADEVVAPIGGGPFALAPGEWTDDTAQAVAIAEVAATGSLDSLAVGAGFLRWFASDPPDVGASTGAVLRAAAGDPSRLTAAADAYFRLHPRGAAGNGALMRTAPVALAHLGDHDAIERSARDIAQLTHGDPLAADGCVLWCLAIDAAIEGAGASGEDGLWAGLARIPVERRGLWVAAIEAAASSAPGRFRTGNGYVVTALQAAWSSICHAERVVDGHDGHGQYAVAVETAVRIGGDTDTVAAITGALAGARSGRDGIPDAWQRELHGWPGATAEDLVRLAVACVD